VSGQQIDAGLLNGRDFAELALLSTGVEHAEPGVRRAAVSAAC